MLVRAPRTGFRIRTLPGGARAASVAAIVGFAVLPVVAALQAAAGGWQPTGDVAVISLRARDAFTGDAPLLGHPTTADRFTGEPSNNPGPVQFWALGASTRALGLVHGLLLGTAVVNGAALATAAWLAFRRGGTELLALTSAALAGLVVTLGPSSLWDPFNSEVATFPMLVVLLATWSVVVGDLRLFPVLALATTFAAQPHVAGAAFVAPLVAVALGSLVVTARRHPRAVRTEAPWLAGALAIAVVSWLPPLLHELGSRPSNVAALWGTASADRPRIGLAFVAERLFAAIAPIPWFLRDADYIAPVSALQIVLAALVVGGAGSVALVVRRRAPGSSLPWLVLLVSVAMVAAWWVGSRQPPLSAFRADGTRWLWVASLGIWVAAAWGLRTWQLARADADADADADGRADVDTDGEEADIDAPAAPARSVGPFVLPAAIVAAAAVAVAALATVATFDLDEVRDGQLMPAVADVNDQALEALPPGRYHLSMEGDQALFTFGPALAAALEADGSAIEVDDNAFGRAFGDHRLGSEVEQRLRVTASSDATAGPDEELVVEVPLDEDDPDGPTIKVFAS